MNDPSQQSERHELDKIAEFLDFVYTRLQGAEMMLELDCIKGDEYRESLRENLDSAARMGISIGRAMDNCGILFEQLAAGETPNDMLMKARVEINGLSVAVRQLANCQDNAPDSGHYHPIFTFARDLTKRSRKKLNRPEIARAYIESLPKADLAKLQQKYPGKSLVTHLADQLRNHKTEWNP